MRHAARTRTQRRPSRCVSLLDGIDMLSRLDGWLGAACLVTLTGLMLAEVLVRALSDIFPWVPADIPVAWEYSSYLMARGLHLRRGDDPARRRPYPRDPGAGPRVARDAALDGDGAGGAAAWLHRGFLAWAMVYFTWRSFDVRPDLGVERRRWSGSRRRSSPSASSC